MEMYLFEPRHEISKNVGQNIPCHILTSRTKHSTMICHIPCSYCGKKGMGCYVRGEKNSMGSYVHGDKNSMGCFVQVGKFLWDVLSGVAKKMAWDVLSRDVLSGSRFPTMW